MTTAYLVESRVPFFFNYSINRAAATTTKVVSTTLYINKISRNYLFGEKIVFAFTWSIEDYKCNRNYMYYRNSPDYLFGELIRLPVWWTNFVRFRMKYQTAFIPTREQKVYLIQPHT